MPDYKKMYLYLFNEVTDIIEKLKSTQMECETMYLEGDESNILRIYKKERGDEEQKKP